VSDLPVVVNLRHSKYDIDISRRGKWGNPFRIGRDGDRPTVIKKYRKWFFAGNLCFDIEELRGKRLGCYCKPEACHGDVLVEFFKDYDMKKQRSKKIPEARTEPGPLFPDVPELDWLAEMCETFGDRSLEVVYKYLLWSRRYHLTDPKGREHLVAYGFVVKYHHLLYGIEPNPADAKSIAMAKIGLKELRKEREKNVVE